MYVEVLGRCFVCPVLYPGIGYIEKYMFLYSNMLYDLIILNKTSANNLCFSGGFLDYFYVNIEVHYEV